MIKQTFRVSDMHCSTCPMHLESLEDELPGILRISASYAKGSMVVEYDEDKISEEQIIEAVRQKGYTTEPVQV